MNKQATDIPTLEATRLIREQLTAVSKDVVADIYDAHPSHWEPFGPTGREKSVRDARYHLTYLVEALEASDPTLFTEYIAWAKVLFAGLNLPDDALSTTLRSMSTVLKKTLPAEMWSAVSPYLKAGLDQCAQAPSQLPSFLPTDTPLSKLAHAYLDALLKGQRHIASQLIIDAVEEGAPIKEIYLNVFQPVQREVGRLWQQNQVSVAQEHYCTAATQLIMSQLYPKIFNMTRSDQRLVATCVGGELHEIGVRMVADFFEMEGWDTYYLGSNTPASSILQTIEEQNADVLAISATIPYHVSKVAALIENVRTSFTDEQINILVGGYPFNTSPNLWQHVGADGFAPNAQEAIALANKMTSR